MIWALLGGGALALVLLMRRSSTTSPAPGPAPAPGPRRVFTMHFTFRGGNTAEERRYLNQLLNTELKDLAQRYASSARTDIRWTHAGPATAGTWTITWQGWAREGLSGESFTSELGSILTRWYREAVVEYGVDESTVS